MSQCALHKHYSDIHIHACTLAYAHFHPQAVCAHTYARTHVLAHTYSYTQICIASPSSYVCECGGGWGCTMDTWVRPLGVRGVIIPLESVTRDPLGVPPSPPPSEPAPAPTP